MPNKLILNRGPEEQVHEFDAIEKAFDAAVPFIMDGFIARMTDTNGVVKYTQALSEGQIATYPGEATAIQKMANETKTDDRKGGARIPRKLIASAFALFETKSLLEFAEHCGIKLASELPKEKLCLKLANRDNSNFLSCSWYFRLADLKKVAELFGVPTRGVKKEALFRSVRSFVEDYDKIAKGLTFDSVFANVEAVDFRQNLKDWMDVRRGKVKFEELSEGEQTLWWITFGIWEINGDGLSALFDHNSDDFPFRFIASLHRVGAKKSAKAIESIGKKIFSGSIPQSMEERSRRFEFDDDEESDKFYAILQKQNAIWESACIEIPSLTLAFAKKNPNLFQD